MPSTNKIRVLIVDDSFFMRKLLREILESDKGIEVVGTAKDGDEAIQKSKELMPDVITMDYNMPGKNGIDSIKKILEIKTKKRPAIIMISAHTLSGSSISMDCLRFGAVDFISKPSGELSMDIETIKDDILLKIHIASMAKVTIYKEHKQPQKFEKIESKKLSSKVVVIGSSTGGPPLVEDLIQLLPLNLNATVVIVQHMPTFFICRFADRLDKVTPLRVLEARDGDKMTIGKIYLVPADFDFEISEDKTIKLIPLGNYEGAKPSIDRAMESVVKIYKDKVIGVILSGMGEDGLIGARIIKKAGGVMIAQEPKTAVIDSMPNSIISAGLADKILPPNKIPESLVLLVN